MIEKPVLLDPDESTFGAHMELIQDGTISVRSGVDFKRFPPNTVDKLVEDHTSNCSICGQLPYARRPPEGPPAAWSGVSLGNFLREWAVRTLDALGAWWGS